jgi:UDP-N-acetylmuramate--alanine ligase
MCADDPMAARLASTRAAVRTYGTSDDAYYRIVDEVTGPRGSRFVFRFDGDEREVTVPVGVKAVTNAAGALALANEVGVDLDAAAAAIAGFGGVARRFQYRGEQGGVSYIDDYAHLPSEVAAAIATAQQGNWDRVVAVFQPHRYTRTAALWHDFADAFTDADAVVLTDVYPAGETPIPGVSGRLIVHAVLDAHPALPLAYLPRRDDLRFVPKRYARAGDLVLTLGAGDLTTLPDEWLTEDARS